MTRLFAIGVLALFCVQASDTRTVLLRDGRQLTGVVTETETGVSVRTSVMTHRFPHEEVLTIYRNQNELYARCLDRMEKAKKLYEQAKALDGNAPSHNEKLRVAVVILADLRDIYEAMAKNYGTDISVDSRKVMQLMRMCRSEMWSERSNGSGADEPELIPLDEPDYRFKRPNLPDVRKRFSGELGPGQRKIASDLKSGKPNVRMETANKLAGPPSPAAIDLLLDCLKREQNDKVLQALVDALRVFPADDLLPKMDWLGRERNRSRIMAAFLILRARAGDKTKDFLLDLFVEGAPPEMWPMLASFFREYREWIVPKLESALGKKKDKTIQSRIIKMLGLLRDPEVAKTLVRAMKNYPVECFVALEVIGPLAAPSIMFGAVNNPDQNVRKYCTRLLQNMSGLNKFNTGNFNKWFQRNRKALEKEDEDWWIEQEKKFYPVDRKAFNVYNRKLGDLIK